MLLDNTTIVILAFALGIITKSLLILKPSKEYLGVFISSLIAFIFIYLRSELDLNFSFFVSVLLFTGLLALIFRDQLMSNITEKNLLLFSIIFIYVLFSFSNFKEFNFYLLTFLLFLPFSIILLNFINITLYPPLKFILYFWFLSVNIYFSFIILFRSYSLSQLNALYFSKISILEAFILGFNLFYLIVNLIYLIYLIPIPGRHQSIRERIQNVKEHILTMISKHSDIQTKSPEAITLILVITGLILINNFYNILSKENLLLFLLTMTQFINRGFSIKS